jgi:hypothetical protein
VCEEAYDIMTRNKDNRSVFQGKRSYDPHLYHGTQPHDAGGGVWTGGWVSKQGVLHDCRCHVSAQQDGADAIVTIDTCAEGGTMAELVGSELRTTRGK